MKTLTLFLQHTESPRSALKFTLCPPTSPPSNSHVWSWRRRKRRFAAKLRRYMKAQLEKMLKVFVFTYSPEGTNSSHRNQFAEHIICHLPHSPHLPSHSTVKLMLRVGQKVGFWAHVKAPLLFRDGCAFS